MASDDMAFAPPLPPSPPIVPPPKDALALGLVVVLVLLAVVAILLLHLLGPLRRWLSHGLLHHIVMGIYTLSYPLVSYTIGQMKTSDWYFYDYTVWAVLLLLLLSSTDSLTVCRLSDIESWKSIYVKLLFKGFLLVLIFLKFGRIMKKKVDADYLWYPLSAILFVAVIKSYVMVASMRMVSNSYLGNNVKVIAEYMQYIDNKVGDFDPVTLRGYQYMVAGEKHCVNRPGNTPWYKKPDLKAIITVEQIWQCEGNLLKGDQGKVLKDLCLSMALSKMLNRRLAGFKLLEAELKKTHDFVFKGLLAGDEERAFRVIEEELVFLHDMYYTRYSYLYQKGRYLALCLPVIMVALCSWLTENSLHVKRQDNLYPSNQSKRSVMSGTIAIPVVVAFLEAYQLYLYMASGWFKVALIRSYVTPPFLQTRCFSEMIMRLLLMLKAFRPWKGRLGQYCFLENLGRRSRVRNCLHYATLRLVDKAMKKGKQKSVKLSGNVKKAIVDSLLGSNGYLTNGVASLKRNGVHDDLSWACDATATDGAVSRTILVWHIATTLCEHMLDKQGKEAEAVRTASTLSKYCMHLLAFAPNLLPDHSSISEAILEESINKEGDQWKRRLGNVLERSNDLESRCKQLLTINVDDGDRRETPLVAQGAELARQIEGIQDLELRWKVLSDFWAEMMLYVSPSDDSRVHLEFLARGGEFITHLWALLTHAGVLKRGHSEPKGVV